MSDLRDCHRALPRASDLFLRMASAYQKPRWVTAMTNPHQTVFGRISNHFLPTNYQFLRSPHSTMIIGTYKVAIKPKLGQCFKNDLRAVLDTTAGLRVPSVKSDILICRKMVFPPWLPREKAPLALITDNTNEPCAGNNGFLHAFDSSLPF